MFENTTVRGKSKPSPLHRQGSRQGLMLRSHQVPIGKWHLKSLMLAMLVLVVFLYYAHVADEQSGVKPHTRELVVRPAKPYKSPSSRRRHSRQHKGGKGIQLPVKGIVNISLISNKQTVDFKNDKSKVIPVQQPKMTTIRPASNNVLQFNAKSKNSHKSKVLQNLPAFSQVDSVKNQHLNTYKYVKVDKKPLPDMSPQGFKVVPNVKIPQQANYNMRDSNDMMHQSTKSLNVLRYLNNNNGSFNILKPLLHNEVHNGANNKPVIPANNGRFHNLKPVVQAKVHDDANKPVIPPNNGRFNIVKPVGQAGVHDDANNKPVIPANNGIFHNLKPVAQAKVHDDANKPVIPPNNGRFNIVKPVGQAGVQDDANNKPVIPANNDRFHNLKPVVQAEVHHDANKPVNPGHNKYAQLP